MSRLLYGDSAARKVSERIAETVATVTAMRAIPTNRAVNGMVVLVQADYSLWQFHSTCALTGDNILVAEPSDSGAGAWLRVPGAALLSLPITYATADAAVLLTVPTGCVLQPLEFAWKVAADFTGGTASAIGVSSSNLSGHTTKGDLLGGATGDLAATLVASSGEFALGTIGAAFASVANRRVLMKPTETLRFDRITSAFTAGTGSVLVACNILKNAGA
jgi:hypothetical protein